MSAAVDTHGLPLGTRLGEFEITERLGEGGFSIVYLAWDHSLERKIALKEYMPSSIATRTGTSLVSPRSERHRDTFELGLKSFINEGKLLAQFDHPSLVKVYRFWEQNGTAYMVMPFYQGVTVKDTVRALPAPPDEAWLRELLAPLTAALCVIHADKCYHRDIAPDNVILLAGSNRPLLLDFGAARRVIGDMTQALTVILKPGYAPVEQYAEVPGMKQGPWTDVYALGATVYWAITGKPPPPSVGRMLRDSHVPLAEAAAGRYSAGFLEAIDRALAILPEQRTQSIDAFRQDLGIDPRGTLPPPAPHWADPDATVIRSPATTTPRTATATQPVTARAPAPAPSGATATVPLPATAVPTERLVPTAAPQPAAPPDPTVVPAPVQAPPPAVPRRNAAAASVSEAQTQPSRTPLIGMALVGLAIAAGGTWWMLRDRPAPATSATPQTTEPAASTTTSSPPPAPPPTVSAAPAAAPATPAPPAEAPAATAPVVTPPAAETTPAAPPPSVASTPPEPKVTRPPPKTTTAKAERPAEGPDNRAECARVMSQLSIGDSSPALMERLRTLKCR